MKKFYRVTGDGWCNGLDSVWYEEFADSEEGAKILCLKAREILKEMAGPYYPRTWQGKYPEWKTNRREYLSVTVEELHEGLGGLK